MRWKGAVAAFLVAQSAAAETLTDGTSGFSLEVDTSSACVIVPPERRTEAACRGIEPIPTKLPTLGGREAHYVFLASIPLPAAGRYWLGVIRLVPRGGVDRDGLTSHAFSEMQQSLRNLTTRGGAFDVSEPNPTEVRTANDIDYARVSYEAWTRADRSKRYASDFSLYFGSDDYVIQAFSEATDESAVESRVQRALATIHVQARQRQIDGRAIDRTLARIRDGLILAALSVISILVLRDALKWRTRKPKRDPSAADLRLYDRALRVGVLAAIGLLASVAVRWAAYAVETPSIAKLLNTCATFVSWLAVAPLLLWVHRVVLNARALGCSGVVTATMAVTWFFVPAASAYMPYRVLGEVAASSRRRRERMGTVWLVAAWWFTWIVSIAVRFMEAPAVASVLTLAAAVALWMTVIALDRDQEHLRRRLEKTKSA